MSLRGQDSGSEFLLVPMCSLNHAWDWPSPEPLPSRTTGTRVQERSLIPRWFAPAAPARSALAQLEQPLQRGMLLEGHGKQPRSRLVQEPAERTRVWLHHGGGQCAVPSLQDALCGDPGPASVPEPIWGQQVVLETNLRLSGLATSTFTHFAPTTFCNFFFALFISILCCGCFSCMYVRAW